MKKASLLIFLLLLVIGGFTFFFFQQNSDTNAVFVKNPKGFRGIEWGQDIDTVGGMILLSEEDYALNIYERENENREIDGIQVSSITYFFFQGKLEGVNLDITNPDSKKAMVSLLRKTYGENTVPMYDEQCWMLNDKVWVGHTAFSSEEELDKIPFFVNFYYRPLADQLDKLSEEQEKQGE